tara:strand:+ start:699 stop:905 length:207 start_codon:yes stop_codon:yes gene_type:complete
MREVIMDLCEECKDVADEWDIGIYGMAMIGDEVEDHECMAFLYPEDKITCECACFKGQHLYRKHTQLS